MCRSLPIDELSIIMRDMVEMIGRTYKNGSYVKRCVDRMKEITSPRPKTDMEEYGVTRSKYMAEAKIFEYQIQEYVKHLITMRNGPKAAYSLELYDVV